MVCKHILLITFLSEPELFCFAYTQMVAIISIKRKLFY